MPGRRKSSALNLKTHKGKSSKGNKPIFTDEQKRLLDRKIRGALKEKLRSLARSL